MLEIWHTIIKRFYTSQQCTKKDGFTNTAEQFGAAVSLQASCALCIIPNAV